MADYIYLGPTSTTHGLENGKVYKGSIPAAVATLAAKVPAVFYLVVNLSDRNRIVQELKRKGSAADIYYRQIADGSAFSGLNVDEPVLPGAPPKKPWETPLYTTPLPSKMYNSKGQVINPADYYGPNGVKVDFSNFGGGGGGGGASDNVVSVKDYGATGDPTQDPAIAHEAFQTAVDLVAARGGGTIKIPAGHYVINESIAPKEPYSESAKRTGGISFIGENMYATTIEYKGTGYAFDFTKNANSFDALDFVDFNVDTETGGGIKLPQGGQVNFLRYWANGAAADKWALYMDGKANSGYGIYMVDFTGCRFWRSEDRGGFLGRVLYINDYHTVSMQNVFMSQQRYNGSVIVLKDGKNAKFDAVALEGMSSETTKQAMMEFEGFNTNVTFDSLYIEGWWNIGIKLTDPDIDGAQKNFSFNNVYAWCYGRHDAQVMVAGANDQVTVDGLSYKSDSTTVSEPDQYIIHDPHSSIKLNGFNNNSPTEQQKFRPIKQGSTYSEGSSYMIVGRENAKAGEVVTSNFDLPGQGTYLVSIAAENFDRNHGRLAKFFVTIDKGANEGYGFHDVQEFGTQTLKNESTLAPSIIGLTVTEDAKATISLTVPEGVEAPGWRVNYSAVKIGEFK